MKKSQLVTFILMLIAVQAGAEQELPLKEAIVMAMGKNNLIKAAGFNAAAADRGVDIVKSRYYPAMTLEENFSASNAPTQTFMMKLDQGRFAQNDFQISNLNHPSNWYDFKTTLSLQQPLYVPSLSPLKELAVKESQKSALELETLRQDIAFQVFSVYLEVLTSDGRLKAAEKTMTEARETMRLATVRTAAGAGLLSDELRARTQQSQAEQRLIAAHNNLALTRMKLAMLIGVPDDYSFSVHQMPDNLAVPPLNKELMDAAVVGRTDLKLSRVELEKSEAAVKLARSGYFPTIGAFASYQINGKDSPVSADNDAWLAGINLKWPLFEGFRSNHEHNRAVAGRSAALELLENRSRELRYQLKESFLRRDETGKQLEVARHALLDAEEAVRLITKRFENSLATMAELLDAQNALAQFRANLIETEAGYVLAGGRVYYAAGLFLKEMLK